MQVVGKTPRGASRVTTIVDQLSNVGSIPRPAESMDPLIDATERAVSRYGILRTSMSDLAREMSVARTTLYRMIDSVEEAFVLVGTRTVYRFLDEMSVAMLSGAAWPDLCIDAVVRAVSTRFDNPAIRRVVEREPELLGQIFTGDAARSAIRRLGEVGAPVLRTAMATGQLRAADPRVAAELLARTIIMLIICPPDGDLHETVAYMISPLFTPS